MFSDFKMGFRVADKFLRGFLSPSKLEYKNKSEITNQEIARFCITSLISMILLTAGLYILLSKKYDSQTEKFATGVIGVLIGYWLK